MITRSEAIEKAREHLSNPAYPPDLIAYMLLDHISEETEESLYNLAWVLSHYGSCHRNDIRGLIELMECV